jgi:predicted transport protein
MRDGIIYSGNYSQKYIENIVSHRIKNNRLELKITLLFKDDNSTTNNRRFQSNSLTNLQHHCNTENQIINKYQDNRSRRE